MKSSETPEFIKAIICLLVRCIANVDRAQAYHAEYSYLLLAMVFMLILV